MSDFLSSLVYTKSVYNLVDYYWYIKTVEYLIAVSFFVAFPAFYMYLNKEQPGEHKSSH